MILLFEIQAVRRVFVILAMLLFCDYSLYSQTIVVGVVTDDKKAVLAGVSISLVNSYDGAVSDSSGRFSFKTNLNGEHGINASLLGYKPSRKSVVLDQDTVVVNFVMEEAISELRAVEITAGSFSAGDKKRITIFKPIDILTTAGANADISVTLQTLPGVQKSGDQEGLFVRGGSGTESKVIIDGSVVNNFYHPSVPGYASRGRFSPMLFKGMHFSSGGYSAQYGQALSAVLALESVDMPEQSEFGVSISPIFVGAQLQKINSDKTMSFGVGYSYSNLALYTKIFPHHPSFTKAPSDHEINTNVRIKTKRGGLLKWYLYWNSQKFAMERASLDNLNMKNLFGLKNKNLFTSLNYQQLFGGKWKFNFSSAFSYNSDDIAKSFRMVGESNPLQSIDITTSSRMFQTKIMFDNYLKTLSHIRFGTELWYQEGAALGFQKNTELYLAIFAESDIYLSNRFALRPGVRFEYDARLNRDRFRGATNISPRLSTSFKINTFSQLSFDYGIFYQTPASDIFHKYSEVEFQRSDHYVLTYQHLSRNYTLRAQLYYKDYRNLLRTAPQTGNIVGVDGSGFARGIDLFWRDRKSFSGIDYWLSYSWVDTKRLYLDYPMAIQPSFVSPHTGSIVIKKFWVNSMIGLNWSWNWSTGRAYYNPNRPEEEYMSDRTPFYSSNNLSINWLPKIGSANSVVVLGISNVFGERQIFGYNYSSVLRGADGLLLREAVTPSTKRMIFIGLFMTWGADRTEDAINSHL